MAHQININKSGKVTALTGQKYVTENIEVNIPTGSANVKGGQTVSASPVIGWDSANKKITAVNNGSATVEAVVNTEGWIDEVSSSSVTIGGSSSKSITDLVGTAQGSITTSAGSGSVTGSNCTLSTTDTSGISVTGKGYVTATATTTAGYTPANSSYATSANVASEPQVKYLTGVTIGNGKQLAINDGTNIWTWSVDESGNMSII